MKLEEFVKSKKSYCLQNALGSSTKILKKGFDSLKNLKTNTFIKSVNHGLTFPLPDTSPAVPSKNCGAPGPCTHGTAPVPDCGKKHSVRAC